jgi:hypothetical protein
LNTCSDTTYPVESWSIFAGTVRVAWARSDADSEGQHERPLLAKTQDLDVGNLVWKKWASLFCTNIQIQRILFGEYNGLQYNFQNSQIVICRQAFLRLRQYISQNAYQQNTAGGSFRAWALTGASGSIEPADESTKSTLAVIVLLPCKEEEQLNSFN